EISWPPLLPNHHNHSSNNSSFDTPKLDACDGLKDFDLDQLLISSSVASFKQIEARAIKSAQSVSFADYFVPKLCSLFNRFLVPATANPQLANPNPNPLVPQPLFPDQLGTRTPLLPLHEHDSEDYSGLASISAASATLSQFYYSVVVLLNDLIVDDTLLYCTKYVSHPFSLHLSCPHTDMYLLPSFIDTNKQRESGPKARMSNILAAKTIADIVRTCLGPRAMLKMMLDPMGGITLTNDGHTILRECEAIHPAAKSIIELSRTQDEEVGDGTTSVIVLAGEMLTVAAPLLDRKIHPVVILAGYRKALEDAEQMLESISIAVDTTSRVEMLGLIKSAIGTKFVSRWNDLMCNLALTAVQTIVVNTDHTNPKSKAQVDIKRFIRVEKIPGGEIEDSQVLDGVMFNKDIVHPKMRRKIENPRILLLDCPLEYKKGESQTNIEITKETEWARLLEIEEEQIKAMCEQIALFKPDLVLTEKGVSGTLILFLLLLLLFFFSFLTRWKSFLDLAQHYLVKAGISAIRRVRKMDNNRIARATGATICTSVFDIKESDIGTKCGLFEVKKIGDEYFTFLVECQDPKACTIMLRGPSKDILNEIDRNLQDAMSVARNVLIRPLLCPGGGASEMAVSVMLAQNAKINVTGVEQRPYLAVSEALEVVPRTLVQNCGGNAIKVLTALRAKHSAGQHTWGVNGESGLVVDMKEYGIWEPLAVKIQTIKTSIESACLLLRVDDIVAATSKRSELKSLSDD
ncbi:T-complex protein 1 subunit gamma, partial [Smittium mucronatum]